MNKGLQEIINTDPCLERIYQFESDNRTFCLSITSDGCKFEDTEGLVLFWKFTYNDFLVGDLHSDCLDKLESGELPITVSDKLISLDILTEVYTAPHLLPRKLNNVKR